jgi:hypothetical protein
MRLVERRIQYSRWANLITGIAAGLSLLAGGFVFHWLFI